MGRFYLPDGDFVYTIEPPWNQNKVSKSCLPEGFYECEPHNGRKYKDTWAVQVPDRTVCVFHVANWARQLKGCIAPGTDIDEVQMMVTNSADAMEILREDLPERFRISIHQYRAVFE